MKKLMVIVPDRLSNWVEKGEVTERYFNPADLFDEVHVVMTNDDQVNTKDIQKTVGGAKLFVYNIKTGMSLFIKSLAWRPFLLSSIAKQGIKLAEKIKPDLIRCHGVHLNSFIAYRINKQLGIPYVISMHTEPAQSYNVVSKSFKNIVLYYAMKSIEKVSLKNAKYVLPVYESIVPYLKNIGVSSKNIKICYNVINPKNIEVKNDYSLSTSTPIKLVSVGRQIEGKYPNKIIRAVKKLLEKGYNIHFYLYGDGAYHQRLKELANDLGLLDKKIFFIKALSNDKLCKILPEYDIFITHTEYAGISKSVLEAQLTGLPMILSEKKNLQTRELQGNHVILLDDDEEKYCEALTNLIENEEERIKLGKNAKKIAWEKWDPQKTEKRYKDIYLEILGRK